MVRFRGHVPIVFAAMTANSYRHPAFDTPSTPPGWGGAGFDLIRIVDPLGNAIAWFAPELGAACVGYAVRLGPGRAGPWRHIFRSIPPPAHTSPPQEYGRSVAWPLPGDPSANGRWRWHLLERDPTTAVFGSAIESHVGPHLTIMLELRLAATIDGGDLSLALDVRNRGDHAFPIRIALVAAPAPGVNFLSAKTTFSAAEPTHSRMANEIKIDVPVVFLPAHGEFQAPPWHVISLSDETQAVMNNAGISKLPGDRSTAWRVMVAFRPLRFR